MSGVILKTKPLCCPPCSGRVSGALGDRGTGSGHPAAGPTHCVSKVTPGPPATLPPAPAGSTLGTSRPAPALRLLPGAPVSWGLSWGRSGRWRPPGRRVVHVPGPSGATAGSSWPVRTSPRAEPPRSGRGRCPGSQGEGPAGMLHRGSSGSIGAERPRRCPCPRDPQSAPAGSCGPGAAP